MGDYFGVESEGKGKVMTRREKIHELRRQIHELYEQYQRTGRNLRKLAQLHAELQKELAVDLKQKPEEVKY